MIKGFTCGAFDLLHPGHILMLKEIREQCDFLMIGLHTDPNIDRLEKNKPIETLEERRIRLEACKYVDEIIEYNTESDLYELLKNLKPDIRFLGADWEGKHFTADVHANNAQAYCNLSNLVPMLKFREQDLGQYIFLKARVSNRVSSIKRPSWLYRSYPNGELD